MRKVRTALRLKAEGFSERQIALALLISRSTVADYLLRARMAGLGWPLPERLDEASLEAKLFPSPPGGPRPMPDWAYVHTELRRKAVTLHLLWQEYKAANSEGYGYTQYCTLYRRWAGKVDVVLRQPYKAGEKGFVDYAGMTVPIIDRVTGEVREAQMFSGALGASNLIFTEGTWTQTLPDWIGSHVRMFEYWAGVPEILVPDNLKSGVKHACYYEPEINPTYQDLADHYGTVVIPARQLRPRDKAKVETSVQIVEREILAPLRNHRFFSLGELNREISRRLEQVNNRPFQKLEGSRRSLFEAIEKAALRPLAATRYELAEWHKARVNIDCHIQLDWHFYSVPYQLVREAMDVRLTTTMVEVLFKGQRRAAHPRSHVRGGYTTDPSHLPKAHQQHLAWSPSRLIAWGAHVGPATAELVERILATRKHPEQGYRSCLGLMSLARKFGQERLEGACRRALAIGAYNYKSVKSILERGLDRMPLEAPAQLLLPEDHDNVRGASYYAQGGNGTC